MNGSLATPSRYQSIAVIGDDGTTYFTGYIAVSPLPEYAGCGIEGPRYRIAIQAVSDEYLLDQLLMPPSAGVVGENAGALLTSLVAHTGVEEIATSGVSLSTLVGTFSRPGGELEPACRTSGRDGARSVSRDQRRIDPRLRADHHPSAQRNRRQPESRQSGLYRRRKAGLANDVTVCGENEPVAYVTEYFLGDGVTTQFDLAADP